MAWVLTSLASSLIVAAVFVFSKRILMVHVPGVAGYRVLIGGIWITIGAWVLLAMPWQSGTSGIAAAWAIVAGLCSGVSLSLLVTAVSRLEVSRVVAGYHTYPVFVAIMASLFLGESLSLFQWIAIVLVVVGGGLIMLIQNRGNTESYDRTGIIFVFLASAGFAVGVLTVKAALNEGGDPWNVFGLRSVFIGAVFVISGFTPQGIRQVKMILSNRRSVLFIFLAEIGAQAGIYLMILALSIGSAASVTTLLATQPVFVLLLSSLLSTRYWNVLGEPLTKEALGLKTMSVTMVVIGAIVLTLS